MGVQDATSVCTAYGRQNNQECGSHTGGMDETRTNEPEKRSRGVETTCKQAKESVLPAIWIICCSCFSPSIPQNHPWGPQPNLNDHLKEQNSANTVSSEFRPKTPVLPCRKNLQVSLSLATPLIHKHCSVTGAGQITYIKFRCSPAIRMRGTPGGRGASNSAANQITGMHCREGTSLQACLPCLPAHTPAKQTQTLPVSQ